MDTLLRMKALPEKTYEQHENITKEVRRKTARDCF